MAIKVEKNKKPGFVVKESNFSARVKSRWRFPRGKHSKVRQMHKGRPVLPSAGFGRPAVIRGFHPYGVREVVVATASEIEVLDPETQGAMISSTVGMKRRVELLKLAASKGVIILNVKDSASLLKNLEERFSVRKLQKEKLSETKKKRDEEKKKVEVKETNKVEKTAEEKKEEERKMAEKTITKKQ